MARRLKLPTHFAPVFGFITAALEIDKESACRLFVFCTLRGLISSAIRLGIFGPMEGQALQMKLAARAERVAARAMLMEADDAAQTAPMLDLLQGAHDRLYSRLFQS
jgi:urease accessory protein